ncbi:MAG: VanZ family protein [Gammaproteobacteria bacterium]|nr:VanZ family protein [Gammaproteobacteria bacterium]
MRDNPEPAIPPQVALKLVRFWYLLGVLMLIVVGALSLLPMPEVGVSDKLSHVVTYVFLAGWFSLLAPDWRALAATVIGLMAYGILLELLQGMTTYRYLEWADMVANGSGIVIGALFYFTPLTRVLALVDRKLARLLSR